MKAKVLRAMMLVLLVTFVRVDGGGSAGDSDGVEWQQPVTRTKRSTVASQVQKLWNRYRAGDKWMIPYAIKAPQYS